MSCAKTRNHPQPVLKDRHTDVCPGHDCPGCEPCPEQHCETCNRNHAQWTCAQCLDVARRDLHAISTMYHRLPTEAIHRGVHGAAMMMLGPTTDPEAWHHKRTSALAGRIDPGYLLDNTADHHPGWVLAYWEQVARRTLNHPTDLSSTVDRSHDYLDTHLHTLADHPAMPFNLLAGDLFAARNRLEAVLRDGEQRDTTRVPCLECGTRLIKTYADNAHDDHYRCPYCRATYDQGRYERAQHDHLASAGAGRYVPLADAIRVIGRPEVTVRKWIRDGTVNTIRDPNTHRLLAWWPDIRAQHLATPTRTRKTTA